MTERYSIGKVSIACNIPIKTLRYYDEIDLLKPEYRDNDSNYRYYSKDQMTTILCIRRLRSLGFCLKDIKELISRSDLATIEEKVNYRCQTIIEEIDLLNAKMEACQSLLHRVSTGSEIVQQHDKQNPNSNVQVKIEEIPATTMFSTRKVMKQYRSTDVSLDRWQTLYDNLRFRKHCENGMKVAQWLERHPAVSSVFYPGLPSHPQYELAKQQFSEGLFGGMVSFELIEIGRASCRERV